MSKELLSIVVPAWNEEKTLEEIISRVLAVKFPPEVTTEVIIVNDGSTDSTATIAKRLAKKYKNVHAFDNKKNSGKSQTVRNGLVKTKGDIVVVQDADFEYNPKELVGLLRLMKKHDLDVVYGNRFGKKNKVVYWQNYLGNRFLSLVSNIFTYPRIRTLIPDMEVCYKMMRGDVARKIGKNITAKSSFGLEPEVTAKLSRYKVDGRHLRFGVVSISYKARTFEEGKKMHAFRDGIKALKEILVFNISK